MMGRRSSIYARLSSVDIWNRELLFYSAFASALLSLINDCMRLNNYSPLWIVVDVVPYLATVIPIYLFKRASIKLGKRQRRSPVLNIVIALVMGGFHNWFIAILALETGLETLYEPGLRWVGGGLMGLAAVWVSAALFTSVDEHNRRMSVLLANTRKLDKFRKRLAKLVEDETEKLKSVARNVLIPQIELIQKDLASSQSGAAAVQSIKNLITNDLRPMNLELARRASTITAEAEIAGSFEDKPQLPKYVNIKMAYRPIGVAAMVSLQQLGSLYIPFGVYTIPISALTGALTLLAGLLIKQLVPVRLNLTTGKAMGLLALLTLASTIPLLAVDYVVLQDSAVLWPAILSAFAVQLLIGTYLSYLAIIQISRAEIEAKLARLNEKLQEQNSVFNQKLWIAKRQWLSVLHGTVQASLTAALARLNEGDNDNPELLAAAQADLNRAQAALKDPEAQPLDIVAAFTDLQNTWEGICEISVDASLESQQLVLSNEQAKICANELIKEAVSNAIRHGKASKIWISVKVIRSRVIELTVENNGHLIIARPDNGVGSMLFDDLALNWSRGNHRDTGIAYVKAELAVA